MQVVVAEQIVAAQPPPRLARRATDASFHATLLGLSAAVLVLSVVLRVAGERQVMLPFVDIPLPGVCTYQRWFGLDCPGCGLTRCFVSIGHGDLSAAWRFNPAGILGFVLVAVQIPYRSAQLMRVRRGAAELQFSWIGQILFWAFFALLLVQWTVRTFFV